MARKESIQYAMTKRALSNITNANTVRAYKHDIREFSSWARSVGYRDIDSIKTDDPRRVIQRYRDEVVLQKTSSPHTEHRMIAAVCKGLDVQRPRIKSDPGWEGRITTTRRTSDRITRGRSAEANVSGQREEACEKYARFVDFQKAVGIRRHEITRLRGRDLVTDESNKLAVRVAKGKGGKPQLQRILPGDEELVRSVFKGIAPDQKVFTREETSNHINLHRMRALHAQEAYRHYASIKDPGERKALADEMIQRYNAMHPDGHGASKFKAEIEKCLKSPSYTVRDHNRQKAIELGLPVEYDRLSLMAVSVFHLSH